MDTSNVSALLESLVPKATSPAVEVGVTRGAAYLKVESRVDPDDYAVVSTPGDRWFSLDVAGGFAFDLFEEGKSDVEVVRLIEKLVQAAIAYGEGRGSTDLSRFLKIPTVRIETDSGPVELHLSLGATVRRALRMKPR